MPKFQVTSPDGKTWEVNAPEGATPDQALAFAKQQWSATQQAKPQSQANQAPFEDPGALQSVLIGTGRTFDRIGKGMQQAYYGARSAMHDTGVSDLVTGGNEWDRKLASLKSQAEGDDAIYSRLREARPWATGAGEMLPTMIAPAGGSATLLGNAGRMAIAGGLPGALEYGSAEERLKRGALGAAAGASMPVLGAAFKTAKAFVEPLYNRGREQIVGRLLNQVAGDSAPQVLQRLKTAQAVVPGSLPTAAEVAQSGGISALQRAAAQANPESYTQRAMEQASARMNALRGIAGDDAKLQAAEAARSAAAAPLYSAAKTKTAMSTPELAGAISRMPSGVMAKAQELARIAGEPLKSGVDVPAQAVQSGLLDEFGRAITKEIPAQSSQYSGKALHYIKLALDDALSGAGESSLGRTEKALVSGVKDDFLTAVSGQIPEYGQAMATFAEKSKPINRMQVGQELLNKLDGPLGDYGALASETGATYARALRNAEQLVKNSTGMKNMTLEKVMQPQEMQALTAIGQDLARKSNAQNLGRGVGSNTFQNIAMNNIAQRSGLPRLAGGLFEAPGISRATRWLYQNADEKAQGLLSDALLDPARAGGLLEAASKQALLPNSPKTRKALEQSILRLGLLATPVINAPVQP